MDSLPTIRTARFADAPAMQRLLRSTGEQLRADELLAPQPRRHVLVLDAPHGELAAAVVVRLVPPIAHVDMLAIAPLHRARLEARLLGVTRALCAAFGCWDLAVAPHHRA